MFHRGSAFFLLAAVIAGLLAVDHVDPAIVAQETTPAATDIETVARRGIAALELAVVSGDTSGIDAAFAVDYVDHTPDFAPAGQTEAGREELKAAFTAFRDAMSDVDFSVEDVLVEGDRAAVRFTLSGALDPAAFGLPGGAPPPLMIGGVVLVRVADGQIVESWDYDEFGWYLLTLLRPTAANGTPVP